MDPILIGVLGILVLLVLLFFRMHIGVAMALVGFLGVVFVTHGRVMAAIGYFKTVPFTRTADFNLSVIPMFVLMGEFMFFSNVSSDLYGASYKLLGRVRGGLSMATIVASSLFAAICGSATATTATMGAVSLPEMRKYNYKDSLASGCISAGGTLGILIPPSTGFILYGTTATISIAKMFAAGMLPGIILAVCYMGVVVVLTAIDKDAGPGGGKYTIKEKLKALVGILPALLLFVIVIGGILKGWFTATEGGAIGAFGSFIIMIVKGKLTWSNLIGSLRETIKITAMIFLIIIGAYIFGYFLTLSHFPTELANWAVGLNVNRYVILIFMLVVYGILGCFVDSLPLIVLLTPIFLPIVDTLGFSPIWFGVLMVMIMQMGLITPPVGMCCYVMKGVAPEIPLQKIFKGTAPFIVGLVVAVAIVITIPALATWLPGIMNF